ncbi:hypothetical protein [Hyphomicrobium sp. ghe19]|uniref:hypothetical protein n=1 Tax=Hyphomicrobium sp. ghe19 TaxID=2682968 RepID=UPI0030D12F4F
MSATLSMDVHLIMPATLMIRRAAIGIFFCNLDHVFIHMIPMWMIQMGIVEIIDVTLMPDGYVTATGSVDMRLIGVVGKVTVGHGNLSI